MNLLKVAGATAALALALTACSSSTKSSNNTTSNTTGATSSSSAATSGSGITIQNFAYSGTLTVKAGQKVTVTNQDSAAHTLTDKATHKFDTGSIAGSGGTGTFTAPTTPGTYKFGCTFHPSMAGTLIVKA